jgi:hypothetical protein
VANGLNLKSGPGQPTLPGQAEQRPQLIHPAGPESVERNRLLARRRSRNLRDDFRRCGTQGLIHPRKRLGIH